MSKKTIYQSYDFETMEQFLEYIIDSKINGNHSQVEELIQEMNPSQTRIFINWARNTDVQGENLQADFSYCINKAIDVLAEKAEAKPERKPYQRRTEDIYNIMGNYGQGYEVVTAETTRQAAKDQLKCYRDNEPGIAFKIVKKREKINVA